MRFFKPDILVRANSPDDAVTEAADADWESASIAYEARLAELRDVLAVDVRRLAVLNLHDGEVLTWGQPGEPTPPRRIDRAVDVGSRPQRSLVAVKLDDVITSIIYDLAGPVQVSARRKVVPFTGRRQVDWLYDEVDVPPTRGRTYLHRVLLSDGREVEVPFTSVFVQRFPVSPPSSQQITPSKSQVRMLARSTAKP